MELSAVTHIDADQIYGFSPDLFITAVSHESRSLAVARLLEGSFDRKVAFAPAASASEYSFGDNREFLSGHGYEMLPVQEDAPDMLRILRDSARPEFRIMLDGTSMSPRWYYHILNMFAESQDLFEKLHIRFVYTMAAYAEDEPVLRLSKMDTLSASDHKGRKSGRKKALILGLGHEDRISQSIYRQMKPDQLFLFYADPPVDKRYVDTLFVNNHELIQSTSIRKLIAYPIRNGQTIYQHLVDIILPLREEFAIHLVPQGPKIFSVASILAQIAYPDVVISYPRVKKPPMADRMQAGEPVILDIVFEGED